MKHLTKHFILIFLSAICFFAQAQKAPIKLGNVAKEDVEMKVYSLDENADAVVLCDYGYSEFVYNMQSGWENHLKRICRIKILNDDGYDWATESVVLYHDGKLKESLSQLKGFTYNLENGKRQIHMYSNKENIFFTFLRHTKNVYYKKNNVKDFISYKNICEKSILADLA